MNGRLFIQPINGYNSLSRDFISLHRPLQIKTGWKTKGECWALRGTPLLLSARLDEY